MPREIDCPDCGGKGEIITADRSTYPPSEDFMKCFNPDCKNGKITVYTEEEFQEAIGEYANTKLYQEGYRSGVWTERERCALICENISSDKIQELIAGLKLADQIRAGGKE